MSAFRSGALFCARHGAGRSRGRLPGRLRGPSGPGEWPSVQQEKAYLLITLRNAGADWNFGSSSSSSTPPQQQTPLSRDSDILQGCSALLALRGHCTVGPKLGPPAASSKQASKARGSLQRSPLLSAKGSGLFHGGLIVAVTKTQTVRRLQIPEMCCETVWQASLHSDTYLRQRQSYRQRCVHLTACGQRGCSVLQSAKQLRKNSPRR